ncbi:MAG TPA: dTDP-4-dehydrorhamnose 3,5-epimerase [Peptococcaceae bacterium]|nr:MAG: dTDP-4-dehydrorhamnose 3,5-epimerase-like enzyme [Clostridia bacterium 41_269]HBT20546.1 dTDP-4-dehydrorhamnose 3,5-epimerase [Peptococcaceae bacterium]
MEWTKGSIDGVIIKKLTKHVDKRGFLTETFRIDELPESLKPVMSYVSYTEPGVSRGPHEHKYQTDIFSFIGPGNFLIKLWDNRKDSKTYGNYMQFYAGQDNPVTVVIPPGVVHGYKNISKLERGMVINYPDKLYMGWGKKEPVDEIRHEDTPDSPFKMED